MEGQMRKRKARRGMERQMRKGKAEEEWKGR
jgi:hypothetical protein